MNLSFGEAALSFHPREMVQLRGLSAKKVIRIRCCAIMPLSDLMGIVTSFGRAGTLASRSLSRLGPRELPCGAAR